MDQNHNITGIAPADVPPGMHEVTITVVTPPARKRFRIEDLRAMKAHGTTAYRSAGRICAATMAADPVFVDTNVLICLVRPESPFHATAVEKLRALLA